MHRVLTEEPPEKYIEKTYTDTNPVLKQLRQGGKLRGYCFFERIPGFCVWVLVLVTHRDYDLYPPGKFSEHAKGFVDDLRSLNTEEEAEQYVKERAFTPKMWGTWMEAHGMENPHTDE